MLSLDTPRAERRDQILRMAGRRAARNLRMFGSVARGEKSLHWYARERILREAAPQ